MPTSPGLLTAGHQAARRQRPRCGPGSAAGPPAGREEAAARPAAAPGAAQGGPGWQPRTPVGWRGALGADSRRRRRHQQVNSEEKSGSGAPSGRRRSRPGTGSPRRPPQAPARCRHLSAHPASPTPRCPAAPTGRAQLGGGTSLPPPRPPRPRVAYRIALCQAERGRRRRWGERAGGEGVAQQQLLLQRTGRDGRQTAPESAPLARRPPGLAGRGSQPGAGQASRAAAASLVAAGGRAHGRLRGQPLLSPGKGAAASPEA